MGRIDAAELAARRTRVIEPLTVEEMREGFRQRSEGNLIYFIDCYIHHLTRCSASWDELDDALGDFERGDPRIELAREGIERFRKAAEKIYEAL